MDFDDLVGLVWAVFLIAGAAVLITWLVVMQKALDQISHDIRKMEPGAAWLCMIPVFGLVWQFFVLNAVADGIARELIVRNMLPREEKPGYAMGLTGCILICFCIVPYAGPAIGIIGLIFMVIHIVKITEYNREIEQTGRWEVRYNARMAAIRQQMDGGWQHVQNPYNLYPTPQQYYPVQPAAPQLPIVPPQTGYAPTDQSKYSRKNKPENPFG